jgi:RNA polymerase sigma-70 factor (ECF subfamily)
MNPSGVARGPGLQMALQTSDDASEPSVQQLLQQALQHERALRRLAASLLRDPGSADDAVEHALVQEALQRRRPGAPLLPFLRATLRRYASNLRKLARRRTEREAVAARPEAVPSAAEIAAREQLRRRVADAVQALDEPYRTTVWLRWFEDLAAHEVAARMAVPVATVRTRLQRAHAQLRARLDRDYGHRAAWAVLALPFAEVVPVAAVLAFGVSLPKVLASAAVLLALASGYVLWPAVSPRPGVPRRASGVDSAVAGALAGTQSLEDEKALRERIATAAAATPVAASRTVRIVYPDGTPARGLPAWLWHENDRPQWAQRVGDGPGGFGPGVAGAVGEPGPEPPARTNSDGAVDVPADVTALSVRFAEQQWVSFDLAPGLAVVELPAVQPIELHLRGGTADREWEAQMEPSCIARDGGVIVANALRVDLATRSGPASAFLRTLQLHGRADENLRALVLADHLWDVDADGHGMAVQRPGKRWDTQEPVTPPCSIEFIRGEALPSIRVHVVDPDGLPTALPGHVAVNLQDHGEQDRELVRGEAVVDEVELPRDSAIRVDVLMVDGEWLHRDLAPLGTRLQHDIQFVCGSGRAALRLPTTLTVGDVQSAFLEPADGEWYQVQLRGHFDFLGVNRATEAKLQDGKGGLLLSCVPQDALRTILVARDGRIADFALAADGAVTGGLLPSEALAPIDTAAIYREHGARQDHQLQLQVRIATRTGGEKWVVLRLDWWYEGVPPPPVWDGLHVPKELRSRLLLIRRGAYGQAGPSDELPLPRLGAPR